MTALTLAGALAIAGLPAGACASAAGEAQGAQAPELWGQDRGGRFQTHGKDSVATVRGTRWLTTDTCAGTVVKVLRRFGVGQAHQGQGQGRDRAPG